jgi:uncharacterized protein (TIGR03382 family)
VGFSVFAASTVAGSARAHDAPLIQRIVWRPEKSDVMLQTNRGFIFGDPESKRWRLLCNEALHIPSSERPGLAYLPSGRIVVGTSGGVQRSDDNGCTWQAAFPTLLIPALAQDPQQPARIYVATFPIGMASDNVSGDSALRVSDDGGETFSDLLVLPDDDFVNGLAVAPSEPKRVYASGGVYRQSGREFYIARSDDAGASWQRFTVELDAGDFDLRVLAVSPVDPDVVIAKIAPGEPLNTPERVLISRNGGETFTQVASVLTLRDAAFSADGTSVWLAGKEGLFRSHDGGDSFEHEGAAAELSCAVEHDGVLHACGHYDGLMTDGSRNGIGRSSDHGDSYEPWMTFQDVREPVTCDASSPAAATCARPWADWQYEVANMFSPESLTRDGGTPLPTPDASTAPDTGTTPTLDAGTTNLDAGMPAEMPDAASRAPDHDDSGCNASGKESSPSWLFALLLLLRRRKK